MDSLVGLGNRTDIHRLGLGAVALLLLMSAGCSPKRVLRTPPSTQPTESPARTATENAPEESQPVDTDLGLPDPTYRGATGTSSLEAAQAAPPGEPPAEPLTGSRLGLEAAELAKKQLGKPYQWGAAGPDKFDCSGLVMYVYDNLGVPLPRVSGQQAYAGVHVDRKDLQPGDLVFFKLNGSRIDHVGIYLGHSKFVHAPRKHMPVRTDTLNDSYWRRRFKGGRRVG